MCNCFDEMLTRVKEAAKEQLKDVPMVEGSLKSEWRNSVFYFSEGSNAPIALYVDTEYRPLKKDQTPAKNMKRLENGVRIKFCPHCGEEFK